MERVLINAMAAIEVGLAWLSKIVMDLPIFVCACGVIMKTSHLSSGHNQGEAYFHQIGFGFGADRFHCYLRYASLALF